MKSETLDAQREIVGLLEEAGYGVTAIEVTENVFEEGGGFTRIQTAVEIDHDDDEDSTNSFRIK